MNMKAIWSQSEIWKANSTAEACLSAFIASAYLSASIRAASSSATHRSSSTYLFLSTLIASALACRSALTLIYIILVSKAYSIIIINVYPLLLATHTILHVELGSLVNVDAAVEASVAADEVPMEETELAASVEYLAAAALTSASSAASFIPLSEISAASTAAPTRISRSPATTSICRSGSVLHSSSSSLAAAAAAAFSSSVEGPANLKQSEIWGGNLFF